VPIGAILRRHHGESDWINALVTPLHSNCRAPPRFPASRDEIKMPTIPDLCVFEKTVEVSVSENA
jgi:hypothetical protein